jgi:hypothetical protein
MHRIPLGAVSKPVQKNALSVQGALSMMAAVPTGNCIRGTQRAASKYPSPMTEITGDRFLFLCGRETSRDGDQRITNLKHYLRLTLLTHISSTQVSGSSMGNRSLSKW